MVIRRPRWMVKVTHIPTGENITLTSEFHKSQKDAKDMGIKIIGTRLTLRDYLGDADLAQTIAEGNVDDSKDIQIEMLTMKLNNIKQQLRGVVTEAFDVDGDNFDEEW